ncbi:MAG TPA: hypothetical protein VNM66_05960 [Thermodesulfobacteriota bacterium]|nr:hypothetical protein [Thermodesulfobacteriota bacterium]
MSQHRELLPVLVSLLVSVALGIAAPPDARAQEEPSDELVLTLYGGLARPFETDVTQITSTSTVTFRDVRAERSAEFGIRFGHWPAGLATESGIEFGAELEVGRFRPDYGTPTLTATIGALNVLARWPARVSPASRTGGALYLYFGPGVGFERVHGRTDSGSSDTNTNVLVQALAGLHLFLTRDVSVFTEYKLSYAKHSLTFATSGGPVTDRTTLLVGHGLAGVAFHF